MARKTVIRIVLLALIVLTVATIWGQSRMDAEQSSSESSWVRTLLCRLFGDAFADTFLSRYLRKVAHFAEFAVLGAEWGGWFTLSDPARAHRWLCLLPGPLVAVGDELLQFTAPGRSPSLGDVGIDSAGFLCGFAALFALVALLRRARRRRQTKFKNRAKRT